MVCTLAETMFTVFQYTGPVITKDAELKDGDIVEKLSYVKMYRWRTGGPAPKQGFESVAERTACHDWLERTVGICGHSTSVYSFR